MNELLFLARCGWYLLPMGMANVAPVLFRNRFRFLAIPVDRLVGGHGVFGSHKTLRGLLVAILVGSITFWWQQLVSQLPWAQQLGWFDYQSMTLWFGVLAGLGAIVGDLLRSAVKRRLGIRPGGRFVPWDQLDYLTGGILATLPLFQPHWAVIVGTLMIGFILHVIVGRIGFWLGMKQDRL